MRHNILILLVFYRSYFSCFQIKAAKSLRDLSIEKRKCRFRDENENMEFLAFYTMDGCEYECALRNARQKCHCTPWNFPRQKTSRMCDMFGNYCFHMELQNSMG